MKTLLLLLLSYYFFPSALRLGYILSKQTVSTGSHLPVQGNCLESKRFASAFLFATWPPRTGLCVRGHTNTLASVDRYTHKHTDRKSLTAGVSFCVIRAARIGTLTILFWLRVLPRVSCRCCSSAPASPDIWRSLIIRFWGQLHVCRATPRTRGEGSAHIFSVGIPWQLDVYIHIYVCQASVLCKTLTYVRSIHNKCTYISNTLIPGYPSCCKSLVVVSSGAWEKRKASLRLHTDICHTDARLSAVLPLSNTLLHVYLFNLSFCRFPWGHSWRSTKRLCRVGDPWTGDFGFSKPSGGSVWIVWLYLLSWIVWGFLHLLNHQPDLQLYVLVRCL